MEDLVNKLTSSHIGNDFKYLFLSDFFDKTEAKSYDLQILAFDTEKLENVLKYYKDSFPDEDKQLIILGVNGTIDDTKVFFK
jgi:hypothetical protein